MPLESATMIGVVEESMTASVRRCALRTAMFALQLLADRQRERETGDDDGRPGRAG